MRHPRVLLVVLSLLATASCASGPATTSDGSTENTASGETTEDARRTDRSTPLTAARAWLASEKNDVPRATIERVVRIDDQRYHAIVSLGEERAVGLKLSPGDGNDWRVVETHEVRTRAYWPQVGE